MSTNTIYSLWGFFNNDKMKKNMFDKLYLWHYHNYNYSISLYNKNDIECIIKENACKQILEIWDKLVNIQKCDIAKYIIMYNYGGVYTDLDVDTNLNLNSLKGHNVYLATEIILNEDYQIRGDNASIASKIIKVGNFWFYTKIKKHRFWKLVINEALKRIKLNIEKETLINNDIRYTTGRELVTYVYNKYKTKFDDIQLLDYHMTRTYLHHYNNGIWRLSSLN